MSKVIQLTKELGPTDAGAYDVTGLRRSIRAHTIAVYAAGGLALFIACGLAYERAVEAYHEQLRRFRLAAVTAELEGAPPDEISMSTKQLRLRLAQERDENARLRQTISEIASVVVDMNE
jgi:hypothetical protein